jgi:hypothetical protein
MKETRTVIVCTAVVGFIVFIAGISLGWFGFPALLERNIKQVSTAYRTSNSRGPIQRIYFFSLINVSRDNELMTAQLSKRIRVQIWRGTEGSRRLRLPDFVTIGT